MGLSIRSHPPSAATRSASPSSPWPSGSAPPTPSSRTSMRSVPSPIATVTSARVARACLTTLVSASATTKYALASISGGSRWASTATTTGSVEARDQRVNRVRQAAPRQHRREDPVGQLAQLAAAVLGVVERLGEERLGVLRIRAERARASFSEMIVWTRRCWAPSWMSRTTRRRASSAAVSTRARDAVSWARLSAFAIAVSSSAANSVRRASVSTAGDSSGPQAAVMTPQISPSTMIGPPTAVLVLSRRACSPIAPLASSAKSSRRAGRPLRAIFVMTFTPPIGSRAPVGTSSPSRPQPATTVAVSSSSNRMRPDEAASRSCPSSSATASKTRAGGAPWRPGSRRAAARPARRPAGRAAGASRCWRWPSRRGP